MRNRRPTSISWPAHRDHSRRIAGSGL